MSTVVVALVLYIQSSQKYLIVRRSQGQSGAGFWEFPGGKVESGETKKQALIREIKEELSILLDEKNLIFLFENEYEYPTKKIALTFYQINIENEILLTLVDHDDFKWCDLCEILSYKIAPADIPVINYLIKGTQ